MGAAAATVQQALNPAGTPGEERKNTSHNDRADDATTYPVYSAVLAVQSDGALWWRVRLT